MKENTKFYLEVDDFGLLLSDLSEFTRLKKHWPDFKITCFTIPFPKEFFIPQNQKHFNKEKYQKWAKIINSLDWMEVAVHGFSHTGMEFDTTYSKTAEMLKAVENLWKEVGLEYKRIFRAPYWQYSYDALCALKDKGWIVAIDRNFPRATPEGLKTYVYNWSFEERLPKEKIVKGHGHVHPGSGVKNDLQSCYRNITRQIPEGAKFGFISELYSR